MKVGPTTRLTTLSLAARQKVNVSYEFGDDYVPSSESEFVPSKLARAMEAAGKPYYDEERDRKTIAAYYHDVDLEASPAELYEQLGSLVRRTHTTKFGFDPRKRLHPWIDLRPNLRLRGLYEDREVLTTEPVRTNKSRDFKQKIRIKVEGRLRADGSRGPRRWKNQKVDFRHQAEDWPRALLEGPADALKIAENIALIEGYRFFNAEHSVPQSHFDGNKVAKGDLHILFTCERITNSTRGNRVYAEVEQTPENRLKHGWGPKDENIFEPDVDKGEVARATLYFLLRYPGELGDVAGELTASDLQTLLRWHREDPPGLYEKHRNQYIGDAQGNRNPLIDFPELADKIDFTRGLGAYGRAH